MGSSVAIVLIWAASALGDVRESLVHVHPCQHPEHGWTGSMVSPHVMVTCSHGSRNADRINLTFRGIRYEARLAKRDLSGDVSSWVVDRHVPASPLRMSGLRSPGVATSYGYSASDPGRVYWTRNMMIESLDWAGSRIRCRGEMLDGMSGGPLLDGEGGLLGVNTGSTSDGGSIHSRPDRTRVVVEDGVRLAQSIICDEHG